MAGKGSRPRPVDKKKYDENYDRIFKNIIFKKENFIKRFWVSWWQFGEDYRILTWPPPESIKGYWCSGYRDDASAICAVIDTESEDKVMEIINENWGEEAGDLRFCEEQNKDYVPGDRFPLSDWMKERF